MQRPNLPRTSQDVTGKSGDVGIIILMPPPLSTVHFRNANLVCAGQQKSFDQSMEHGFNTGVSNIRPAGQNGPAREFTSVPQVKELHQIHDLWKNIFN